MKILSTLFNTLAVCALLFNMQNAYGQCSTGTAPSYTASCTSQFFYSVSASGVGVTSTISYTGSSCVGSYFNYFSTQGIVAPAGATVTIPFSRVTGYPAYIAVYVDWNNNGIFELTELAGTTTYLASATGSGSYIFTVPVTGVTVGVNLPMRIYLGEPHYVGGSVSAPCSAWWGQSNDYYCRVVCPLTTITATPATSSICTGATTGVVLTAGGAGVGGTYTWSPSTGLSATTGDVVTALPSATTIYTVTGTDVTGCVGTATTTVTVNPLPTSSITTASSSICSGGSVTLSATISAGSTYQWYNGASLIVGATNDSYLAFPTTTTTFSVITTSAAGCSATSAGATVTVYPYPSPAITTSGSLSICAGATVTLSTTTGVGYTYQWYNTGVAISGATNSNYGASTAGDYTVVITGPGACAATSAIQTVVVHALPVASISVTGGTTTFCAGDSVIFMASGGAGDTYQWSNAAGAIPGETNINYTALMAGTYNVTITNSFGCSAAATTGTSVVVNPLPVTTITSVGGTSVCFPNSVVLNVTPGAGFAYQWYLGVPAIAGATNSSYTANATGSYSVRILNTTTGCSAVTTGAGIVIVTIRPKPTATITPSSSLTRFCSYDSVVLNGPVVLGYTYQWRSSGSSIPGATNASYTVHNSGNFRLIVFNAAGCSDTTGTQHTDTVDPAPLATVAASGVLTFCEGGSVTLSAATGAGYNYQWFTSPVASGGAVISGATSATFSTSATAYYHAVITSPQGCITTSNTVSVTSVPPPVIAPAGSTTFCEGINVALSVANVPGAVYQWKRGGVNIPGAVSASYIATSTGYYTCFVNLPGICASSSAAVYVHVYPAPAPVITFDGSTLRTGNYFASYQWYANTVTIAGATSSSVHAFTNAGYKVLVTDTNGCSRLSAEYGIFNLAVENVNGAAIIKIYPNPTTDIIYVDMPAGMMVKLTNTDGTTVIAMTEAKELNVSQLPTGMYMLEIIDRVGRKFRTEKVVKQ